MDANDTTGSGRTNIVATEEDDTQGHRGAYMLNPDDDAEDTEGHGCAVKPQDDPNTYA